GYVTSGVAGQTGANNWKAGGDFLYGAVREAFAYNVTNPDYFDPDTPLQFSFRGHALDREGSLYAQDVYRYRDLSLSAGLRWDGYNLLVKQQAWSPRLGASFYWPAAKLLFHASYDRVFQTPAIENLLLASTPAVASLSDQVLRLPVKPSRGNFYDAGISEALTDHIRLDVDVFRRYEDNFADDDVFLNTGVSFPIAFSHAQIHGVEVRLGIPKWGPFSAFLSYANQTGTGFLPVTGGLLLGDDTSDAIGGSSSFPISQDQRNTAGGQIRYQVNKRLWISSSASYGSGLPTETDSADIGELISQYSQAVVNRVNFERNRVRPSFTLNFSGGATVWKHESRSVDLQ
ncbi:MAG: TonB-dependent receptor, partial [Bryobacteraceae bacterium]